MKKIISIVLIIALIIASMPHNAFALRPALSSNSLHNVERAGLRPAAHCAVFAAATADNAKSHADLLDGINLKEEKALEKEKHFRRWLNICLGIFAIAGAIILFSPEVATGIFSHKGSVLVRGFIGIYTIFYTVISVKKWDFSLAFFKRVFNRILFAVSVPLTSIALAVAASSPAAETGLKFLLKNRLTFTFAAAMAGLMLLIDFILIASKYFIYKDSRAEWKSAFKNDWQLLKVRLKHAVRPVLYIASAVITAVVLWGSQIESLLAHCDSFYTDENYGRGLAVIITPMLFMVSNCIVQCYDIWLSGKKGEAKKYDYHRTLLLSGSFFVGAAIFFTKLMEYYTEIVPRITAVQISSSLFYQALSIPSCFAAIIAIEVIKEIFTRDRAEHPDFSTYASSRIRQRLFQGLGLGGLLMLGIFYYEFFSAYILNSQFSSGVKLFIFNCVDFAWAIVLSFFLQEENGEKQEAVAPAASADPAQKEEKPLPEPVADPLKEALSEPEAVCQDMTTGLPSAASLNTLSNAIGSLSELALPAAA